MLQFQGFKPDALNRMAKTMGYSGDMGEFNKFLNENPEKQEMMDVYSEKAKEMMMGGYVKGYAEGGVVTQNTMTYQQALNRSMDRDVKTPYEQASIDAALALGPGGLYNIPPPTEAQIQASPTFVDNSSAVGNGFYNMNPTLGSPLIEQPFDPRSGQPVQRNPNVVSEYYDSPEYNAFRNDPSNRVGTMDMRTSPYFGRQGSGSIGAAGDQAYEAYLNRSGQTSYLQGGADYTSNPNYDEYIKTQGKTTSNSFRTIRHSKQRYVQ